MVRKSYIIIIIVAPAKCLGPRLLADSSVPVDATAAAVVEMIASML